MATTTRWHQQEGRTRPVKTSQRSVVLLSCHILQTRPCLRWLKSMNVAVSLLLCNHGRAVNAQMNRAEWSGSLPLGVSCHRPYIRNDVAAGKLTRVQQPWSGERWEVWLSSVISHSRWPPAKHSSTILKQQPELVCSRNNSSSMLLTPKAVNINPGFFLTWKRAGQDATFGSSFKMAAIEAWILLVPAHSSHLCFLPQLGRRRQGTDVMHCKLVGCQKRSASSAKWC